MNEVLSAALRAARRAKLSLDRPCPLGYRFHVHKVLAAATVVLLAALGGPSLSGQSNKLIVYGDVVYFYPPGNVRNCISNNHFKRGEPVGFRMTIVNPETGKRDRTAQLVV